MRSCAAPSTWGARIRSGVSRMALRLASRDRAKAQRASTPRRSLAVTVLGPNHVLGIGVAIGVALSSGGRNGTVAIAAPPPKAAKPVPALLSVELLGDDQHRSAALARVAAGLEVAELGGIPRAQVGGELVGRVQNMREALAWVATHAFGSATSPTRDLGAIIERDAPRPGGELYEVDHLALVSLLVTPLSADGNSVAREWPRDWRESLPADLAWSHGHTIALRTPLFAAPASRVPAAAERFATLSADTELLVVDVVDRCTDEPTRQCLRWQQVIARDKNRLHAGYVLGSDVARDDDWRPLREGGPRLQYVPVAHFGDAAVFLVLLDLGSGRPARRLVRLSAERDRYPELAIALLGDRFELRPLGRDGASAVTLPLTPNFATPVPSP